MIACDVLVVGGGPAGLMAADVASAGGLRVVVCERMPTVGRKFLMAGRGGLNITHGEAFEGFITRYGDGAGWLAPLITAFSPQDVRGFCHSLGQETFEGSSGRIFPRAMKASPLLRAWLRRLAAQGVVVRTRHAWETASLDRSQHPADTPHRLRFATPDGPIEIAATAVVLALGGASWPQLGADGTWAEPLSRAGIPVTPLAASNCAFHVAWTDTIIEKQAGAPLKRIAITHAGRTVKGEAVVTRAGLEGGAIYALSAGLRAALATAGTATVTIDLRPDVELAPLAARLTRRPGDRQSLASHLRKAGRLSQPAVALIYESAIQEGRPLSGFAPAELAARIKALPLTLTGMAGLERAISTAGGIASEGLDDHLMLRGFPGIFAAGEMLDWDAPTGGYLLQACLATGRAAGEGALRFVRTVNAAP